MPDYPIREAAILVGGRGTRLQGAAGNLPKPLVDVAGRPFVEWLLLGLRQQGVRRIILCTGHLGEAVESCFGDGARLGLDIVYSRERDLLGTGGALRQALNVVREPRFLALNGDLYCRFDLARLAWAHAEHEAQATLWLTHVPDTSRYGSVELDGDGRVQAFREKQAEAGPGLISAGVYLLERGCVETIPAGEVVSLETDFFPGLVGKGLFAEVGESTFLDIGTPETLRSAQVVLKDELAVLTQAKDESRLDRTQRAEAHLRAAAELLHALAGDGLVQVLAAADAMAQALRTGHKLLLCGNGGSAADCQHLATEFVSRLSKDFERPALAAIALTTDSSLITALANDSGFEAVFERQVEALAAPGDVLIGISTSGGSANVLRAVQAARLRGLKTVGLIGQGGALAEAVDFPVIVPSRDTQHVQEALLPLEHILCDLVEQALYGPSKDAA